MEITETSIAESRIGTLEQKVRELEPLVRGLTAELLDLKAVMVPLIRENGRYSITEPAAEPDLPSMTPEPVPGVPAETAAPPMVSIMQPDGTMQLEPRSGERTVNSPAGYPVRNRSGT